MKNKLYLKIVAHYRDCFKKHGDSSLGVDWERDDLFHVPLDLLANFFSKNVSRNFIIRNDYDLYEYTVYLYRDKWLAYSWNVMGEWSNIWIK